MRFSIEAEQSVIGGLLLDPNRLDEVLEIVQPDDFYGTGHRSIMRYIVDVSATGKAADVITIADAMSDAGMLEAAGGLGYLVEIANNTPSSANVRSYAAIVAERAMERLITAAGQRIAELGDDEGIDVDSKLDTLHGELAGLERRESAADVVGIDKSIKACLKTLDLKHRGLFPEGIKTGFIALDERFGWLSPGDFWVIGARPGQGKTNLALNICQNIASKGEEVLIFSLEMMREQLTNRMIAAAAGIDNKLMRSGALQDHHWPALSAAVVKMKDLKIEICDTPGLDIARLKAISRTRARRGKLGLIMVDYLQLVGDRKFQKTIDIVSSVSRQLKEIAKICNCPVLALAQLNRAVEKQANSRPKNADLRESGQIEQDADIISFIYRDEYYFPDSPNKGMAELITTKMREGEAGTDILGTQFQYCRFVDLKEIFYDEHWQDKQKTQRRSGFDG